MVAFKVLHPLKICVSYKAVKLSRIPMLSWALVPLGHAISSNESVFALSPLMWFDVPGFAISPEGLLVFPGQFATPECQLTGNWLYLF